MKSNSSSSSSFRIWLWILLPVVTLLVVLFFRSFVPGQALFANDGPLGASKARMYEMPTGFFGIWNDLFWLGLDSGSFPPNFYGGVRFLLGPLGYVNFSPLVCLMVLGVCAALFFRALGFSVWTCSLVALAAGLNGNFFSNACWGLPSRATGLGMTFLALAALHSSLRGHLLLKTIAAGLAVGMSISESGDNGAIFSLFVAAFGVFIHFNRAREGEGTVAGELVKGFAQVALVAICAALMAAQTLNIFVTTSYKGVVGQTEAMTPEQKWAWSTQWSLPPVETLRVVVPGLFGYRMDTANGGNYWGGVGRDLSYDQTHQGFSRHSGAGEYAGVLVALLAIWAFAHSFRRQDSAFSPGEKRMIWFWSGAALIALLLSWGHHAPFYQFIYKLPFFSTIRNPMKFMHPFHLCALILFGYGLQGLWRRYIQPAGPIKAQLFEKRWLLGSWLAVALSIVGFMAFIAASGSVARYLSNDGMEQPLVQQVLKHASNEILLAIFFLVVSVVAVWMIQKGRFAGDRVKWAGVVLGLILAVDLARANAPWILYYNYKEKYASNPVLDVLKENAYQHRVAFPPFRVNQQFDFLRQYYGIEWLQHQFQYYNIQALDVSQEPRMAADKAAYQQTLATNIVRYWQLTNARFLFGMGSGFVESLNAQLDPGLQRFRTHTLFTLVQKPGTPNLFDAQTNHTGPFALVEFTGALPRAKLYSHWEVLTNEQATLQRLADPSFDPWQSVVVSDPIATPVAAAAPANTAPGTVDFLSYAPKHIELKTAAPAQSILLLNDRFDPGWTVRVDGKPDTILRCNYIVRGVLLPPGNHVVTFHYESPKKFLFWWHLAADFVLGGLLLCGVVMACRRLPEETPRSNAGSSPSSSPASAPAGRNPRSKA